MRILLCLLLTFFLLACDVVTSPSPAGVSTVTLDAEVVNGPWVDADGDVFHLLVMDAPGTLQIGAVGEDEGALGMDIKTVSTRSVGERVFVSALASDDDEEHSDEDPRYVWALLDLQEDQAVLWLPDGDRLATLIGGGELSGVVRDGDVHLEELSETQWKRIVDDGLFLWDEPLVLRRVR